MIKFQCFLFVLMLDGEFHSMLSVLFVPCNRVYTLIHVLAYRSTEKDYKERDEVCNLFCFIHLNTVLSVFLLALDPDNLLSFFVYMHCKNSNDV